MADSESSFSLTTFSPSGKLVQIEHALAAVTNQGLPALGIQAANGVVLASEKRLSSTLVDPATVTKVAQISRTIGCTYSGMPADFRVILSRARKDAQSYWLTYKEDIAVLELVKRVAAVMQEFTQTGGVRPLGVSLLIAGHDMHHGFGLYQVDPSGAYFCWKGTAIGREAENAKSFLEKRFSPTMEVEDATHTAILTLREGFEGSFDEHAFEIGVVRPDGTWTELTPAELVDYTAELE
ncbi:MAG: uncharacterized protein KVP18_001494 [Porospora cf. gigantea A]|uniref:uncharacterized protein n=1 Tax=Porospora cf. gigantea A TaxID=2853593 RepID=UPI00355982C2|nr:MAG: hypothetical protein KVP18_001494 [Porospora cf. gigantea A]